MGWVFIFLLLDTTQIYTLKPGDSIDKALQVFRIPNATTSSIISVLKSKIDMKKCRIGDKLYITKNRDKFIGLKYEQQGATWLIDSLMRISKLPETVKLLYLKGIIKNGNLWNSLISAGAARKLVYEFANGVFPWDIDFNTETQNGDKFEVLVPAKYVEDRFIGYDKILFARYISKNREFTGVYYSGSGTGYYNLEGKSLRRAFLRAPISYFRISSGYSRSRFHPVLRKWMPHRAVDYAAPKGTPVRSIGDGRVVFAGWKRGFGKQAIIQHPNGFKSYYGHLSGFNKGICKGKRVAQGKLIGWVGSTGLATGPHLDFRLQNGKIWVNPLKLEPPRVEPLKGKTLKEYQDYTNKLLALIKGMETLKKLSPLIITQL